MIVEEHMYEKKTPSPRTRHLDEKGNPLFTNALSKEGSPYLQQHAHNPVDWHPWGEAAFDLAKREKKPILLSVGYSTCHWCHVMEEESFEDLEIAKYMNENYVCIKVDREERPDVDSLYMNAVQLMTGRGGWPLTVWLTPDKKPFFGGTYFPPHNGVRGGVMGFSTLLKQLREVFDQNGEKVVSQADQLLAHLKASLDVDSSLKLPGNEVFSKAFEEFLGQFDELNGGFGGSPKFPRPVVFSFLLRYGKRSEKSKPFEMVMKTLRMMARGGMYDQIGGGFHRYSTDEHWLVPHFEKMLYDNAQLAMAYLSAYQVSEDPEFARIAEEILEYVRREMTSSQGTFFSATDADSEGVEGTFFLWTEQQFDEQFGESSSLIKKHFGVSKEGNFEGKNILTATQPLESYSKSEREKILTAREQLRKIREGRIHPHLDDKVLTSWNGLMLQAFAKGALVLQKPEYANIAQKAADVLLQPFHESKKLIRSRRESFVQPTAFLDDYAFLLGGLITLFEATSDPGNLRDAKAVANAMISQFEDQKGGGFFFTANDEVELLARQKPFYDGAEPSGNSQGILNLLRLGSISGDSSFVKKAEQGLLAFARVMEQAPTMTPLFLAALDFYSDQAKQIVVIEGEGTPSLEVFTNVLQKHYLPNAVHLIVKKEDSRSELEPLTTLLKNRDAIGGKTTAYVCEAHTCLLPTSDPAAFGEQIGKISRYSD